MILSGDLLIKKSQTERKKPEKLQAPTAFEGVPLKY